MSAVIATVVSVLAFLVSIYGVWEKRRDQRHQQFTRLSTLVDELNKVAYEQDRTSEDFIAKKRDVPASLNLVSNNRREVLCFEATDLIRELGQDVAPSQLRLVGHGWSRAGHPDLGEPLFRRVIDRDKTDIETMFSWRALANQLMQLGREGEGREAYRQAIALVDQVSSYPDFEKGDTYIRWANDEASLGQLERARELLGEAEKFEPRIPHLPRRRELTRRVAAARDRLSPQQPSASAAS
jgi:tetratricopeptide (TPR) repeat protein